MKTKTFLSSLILIAFALLGGGSFDNSGNEVLLNPIFVCVFGGFIICGLIIIIRMSDAQEAKRKEQKRLKREQKRKEQTEAYNNQKNQFLEVNGTPDKTIIIKELDINSEIIVYENSNRVFIMGKEYSFKDIISCTFSDTPRVIKGKVTAITKNKNGNVIGRAIVGDLVAGSAGAIIGGTTAKKHTEFIQGDDRTIHDYTVIINMNSISEPIIRIHTGDNGTLTNEIVGLMNVIITRK